MKFAFIVCVITLAANLFGADPKVKVGLDNIFHSSYVGLLKGKRIGLVTNHTARDSSLKWSVDKFYDNEETFQYNLNALFAPEHGLLGMQPAGEKVKHTYIKKNIPVYSLHGGTRHPTDEMLKNIDLLVFDIQDVGVRCYTYVSTLFYVMEEAAKRNIPVIILDRPNPINGETIDGPMLEKKCRSFVGYINVPLVHGMTIGELGCFFNKEYDVGCQLTVVPMIGWQRNMDFSQTGLEWIPSSPQIPEMTSPKYYPITGLIGELSLVNIGVNSSLPFRVIGAPWIDADKLAEKLNAQKFPGIYFIPWHFRPHVGLYAKESCHGVLIIITNSQTFLPVSSLFLILGMLKNLYPTHFINALKNSFHKKEMFCNACGTENIWHLLFDEKHIIWPLRSLHTKERETYKEKRKQHLMY